MIQVPKMFVGAFCVLCPLLMNGWLYGSDFIPGKSRAAGVPSPLEITSNSPERTSIALRSPEIRITNYASGFEVCQAFAINGESPVPEDGSPTVPRVFRFYRIPNTGGAELVVTEAEFDIVENVNPLPFLMDSAGDRIPVKNADVYRRDEWYPPDVAVMSAPMIMRDFRVVGVTLYPVQVNPVTRQARIYRNLTVDVVANAEPGENEITNPHRPCGEWAALYRDNIANLDEHALDDMTRTPGSILILSHLNSNALPWADSLFEWKTRKGYKVTIDARGAWTTAQATTTVRNAYESSNPPLEYVILIGDPDVNWGIPTDPVDLDHVFALGNSGDDLEDIAVGRLSGSSLSAMATINSKIMRYERTPHMENADGVADTAWFHKAFLYAGIGRECAGNELLMRWGKEQFIRHTALDSVLVMTHSSDGVLPILVYQQLGGGVGCFIWQGTWIGEMQSTLPDQINPDGRLPITMTMESATGDFHSSGSACLSESFLCAGTPLSPRGGVCGIGMATAGTSTPVNVTLTGGFIYSVANLGIEHLGTAVVGAKQQLYRAYGVGGAGHYTENHTRWLNLMGDPSLAIYTDVPEEFMVIHPSECFVGSRMMAVTVAQANGEHPVTNALVVLWKRGADSTWVSGLTDDDGEVILPISVSESGEMYLTITKRNCKPYLYTIPCYAAPSLPMIGSWDLDDDDSGGTQGNHNRAMNPGEIIDLSVYIRNYGTSGYVENISATLHSPDPRVSVLHSTVSYPSLAPGDSALGTMPFRIQAARDLRNRTQVLLFVTINSSAGQTTGLLPLVCRAGELQSVGRYFSDEFHPGGTVDIRPVLRNVGTENLSCVSGHLTSLSPWVNVPDADAQFGDIAAGAPDSNTMDSYTLHASAEMLPGQTADMRLIMASAEGTVDTAEFPVTVGIRTNTDPAGPDAYGYYAYDNSDTGYEPRAIFNYVNISESGGVNLNVNDPGEKTTPLPIYATARPLPFGFKFYGQVYDTITICSNGWCAFGNQSSLDMFRNYPIPGQGAPEAMIAPYWDDLATMDSTGGVWAYSDLANHRYIIQWKAGVGVDYATSLDFEVILYDTSFFPTADGNGRILVQYNWVTMNVANPSNDETSGSTIGIQAPGCSVGLNYAYRNSYAPGAAQIRDGRAILFTTQTQAGLGTLQGQVTDAVTALPVSGARVAVDGSDIFVVTGDDGIYRMEELISGQHLLRVLAHRYNEQSIDFAIFPDFASVVNVSLLHPEMSLPADTLRFTIGAAALDTVFQVTNLGNGELDCRIQWNPDDLDTLETGDLIHSFDLSGMAGGRTIYGCEFADGQWWISAGGWTGQPNMLYQLDRQGSLVDSLIQPSTTIEGWTDLAYDGHYIYGCDGADIIGLDVNGRERTRIASRLNPTRSLAYDAETDHFWVANESSNILELDRGGGIIRSITRTATDSVAISGLAWYRQDGFDLYVFGRTVDGTGNRLIKINPETRIWSSVDGIFGQAGDLAAGCAITSAWDSMQVVMGGVYRTAHGGLLSFYHVAINPAIIQLSPLAFQVPPHSSNPIRFMVHSNIIHPDNYRFNLNVHSEVEDTTMTVSILLNVLDVNVDDRLAPALPHRYGLAQNYPNPFNPSTEICYDLPNVSRVVLAVFNALGQKIVTLEDGMRPAGFHQVMWNGKDHNGLPVANGMYFYQIHAGDFTSARKMLLLK